LTERWRYLVSILRGSPLMIRVDPDARVKAALAAIWTEPSW